jgi:hypothetical protein
MNGVFKEVYENVVVTSLSNYRATIFFRYFSIP